MHKVAPDVEFHHIALLLPVPALLSDMLLHALNAVVCATARNTTVGVLNEGALKQSVSIVIVKMMHNSVTELSSEDLTLLGAFYDKTRRGFWHILMTQQCIGKRFEILVKVSLESAHVCLTRLTLLRTCKGDV